MAIKPSDVPPAVPPKPMAKPPNLRPKNPEGNPGYHPSTKGFDHDSSEHTSEDR